MIRPLMAFLLVMGSMAWAEDREPRVLWSARVAGIREGCVAVDGGQVFAPAIQGAALVALDAATGKVQWRRALADTSPFSPVLDEDSAWIITGSCTLYRIDRTKGRVAWSRWLAGSIHSMPAVSPTRVYAAASDSPNGTARPNGWHLVCLDRARGKEIWASPIGDDIEGAPLLADDRVFVATRGRSLRAFDAATGKPVWESAAEPDSMPVLWGDQLVFLAGEGLKAVSRSHGTETGAWDVESDADRPPGTRAELDTQPRARGMQEVFPMVSDNRAFGIFERKRIACLELDTHRTAWSWSAGTETPGQPVTVGGRVYFGTSGGTVAGLDAITGRTLWALKTAAVIADPPAVEAGMLVFHDLNGGLIAVDAATDTATGWGMWGGSPSHEGGGTRGSGKPVPAAPDVESGR